VRRSFGLTCLSQSGFAGCTGREQSRFLPQSLRIGGQPFFQRSGLFETTTLYGHAHLPVQVGGSATGVLITDKAWDVFGDRLNVRRDRHQRESYLLFRECNLLRMAKS
jgi:hypothetical protein